MTVEVTSGTFLCVPHRRHLPGLPSYFGRYELEHGQSFTEGGRFGNNNRRLESRDPQC